VLPLSKKGKEVLTLLIIPHTEKGPVSLKIPVNSLRFGAAALVMVVLFLAAFIHAYAFMSGQVADLMYLKEVTKAQKAEISHLANQTQLLIQQVEEVEALSNQVREILGMPGAAEQEYEEHVLEETFGFAAEESPRQVVGRGGGDRSYVSAALLEGLRNSLESKAEELQQLFSAAEEYQHRMDHTPSIWPAQGRITSQFGYRRSPFTRRQQFHGGVDIGNSPGTPIKAAAHGKVVEASMLSGWGRLIIIEHGYGFNTYYAHLRGFAVSTGDLVTKGQTIGYMGSSGASTGPHLHYEVHVEGERVDPREYMD
jgi:murein DD-endopeptidase MepM/ murein hydrolase activator NlpD